MVTESNIAIYIVIGGISVVFFWWKSRNRRKESHEVVSTHEITTPPRSAYWNSVASSLLAQEHFDYSEYEHQDFKRLYVAIHERQPDIPIHTTEKLQDSIRCYIVGLIETIADKDESLKNTPEIYEDSFFNNFPFGQRRVGVVSRGVQKGEQEIRQRALNAVHDRYNSIKSARERIRLDARERKIKGEEVGTKILLLEEQERIKAASQQRMMDMQAQYMALTQAILKEHDQDRLRLLKEHGDFYQEQIRVMQKVLSE